MTDDAASDAPRFTRAMRHVRAARSRLLDALPLLATVLVVGSLYLPADEGPPALAWQTYSVERLGAAARAGRPAIVDVSASWCAPCVEMERTTFRDASVVALASGFALLRADPTSSDASSRTDLVRLNVPSIPTIILFDRTGREVRRLVGFTSHAVLAHALEGVATDGGPPAAPVVASRATP